MGKRLVVIIDKNTDEIVSTIFNKPNIEQTVLAMSEQAKGHVVKFFDWDAKDPKFVLLLCEKETDKILSATFAKDEVEMTMITREYDDAKHYVKCLPCDYIMRKGM